MKVAKRNFVVEYKSRSRQTKSEKPASIWGDLDLKKAFQQAQQDSTHLFESANAVPATSPPIVEPEQAEQPGAIVAAAPPVQESSIAALRAGGEDAKEDRRSQTSQRKVRPGKIARLKRPILSTAETGRQQGGAVDASIISDAYLATLEAENARLKGQLRKRLSDENAQLKEMLARYP